MNVNEALNTTFCSDKAFDDFSRQAKGYLTSVAAEPTYPSYQLPMWALYILMDGNARRLVPMPVFEAFCNALKTYLAAHANPKLEDLYHKLER